MKILKNLSILLAIPTVLAGCNGWENDFRTNQAREWTPWKPKAETVTQQEDFNYKNGQVQLTKSQASQVGRMLAKSDGKTAVFARILTHEVDDRLETSPLQGRVADLTAHLVKAGVPISAIDVVSEVAPTPGEGRTLTLMIDHTKMIPIQCDGWNYNVGRNVWPEGEPDFDCATTANLSKMIANPRDAIEGRELSRAEATRNDLFEQYYREDKIRPLMKAEKILGGK